MDSVLMRGWRFMALLGLLFIIVNDCVLGFRPTDDQTTVLHNNLLTSGPIKAALDHMFLRIKETDPNIVLRYNGFNFYKYPSRMIGTHHSLPNVIVKAVNFNERLLRDDFMGLINGNRNMSRLIVNQDIANIITHYKLKHIITPRKYVYHIPGTPEVFDDSNYLVVVEKLNVLCDECNNRYFAFHLTSQQEQEINFIIDQIGYGDAKPANIRCVRVSTAENLYELKLAFIDTEPIFDIDFIDRIPGVANLIRLFAASQGHNKLNRAREKLRSRYRQQVTKQGSRIPHRGIVAHMPNPLECSHVVPCY